MVTQLITKQFLFKKTEKTDACDVQLRLPLNTFGWSSLQFTPTAGDKCNKFRNLIEKVYDFAHPLTDIRRKKVLTKLYIRPNVVNLLKGKHHTFLPKRGSTSRIS